jgi:plastocyanin
LLILAAALALAAGGYAASSSGSGASAKAPAIVVRVVAKDFGFSLSRRIVPVGRVRFIVVNKGVVGHDFALGSRKTAVLRPGGSASIEITFTRAGSYPYRCTVPGHAALGMKGVLTVRRGAPTAKP